MDIEEVAAHIVDAAIKIHTALGPGLLESAYQKCLAYELRRRGAKVEIEVVIPIRYEDLSIDNAYRADMRVEGNILIENKTVDTILPIHQAQLLTYLRLSGCPLGFLINWKVMRIKDGIRRLIWRRR